MSLGVAAFLTLYLHVFSLTWGSLVAFAFLSVLLSMIFELWQRKRESDECARKQAVANRERQEQLATGEGWGRLDVLQQHKTTIFFRNGAGRTQPTEGWRCAACGKNLYKASHATVDHVRPQSKYPHLRQSRDNLQILCKSCNSTKSAYDGEDWKSVVRKRRHGRRKRLKGNE